MDERFTTATLGMMMLVASTPAVVVAQAVSDRATSTHLGDNQRTGYVDAKIPASPVLKWTYVEKHSPRQAWKEPNRELQYIDFDYATQVAVGGGLVVFGSSADHTVRALELKSGREQWRYYTEGPIRFAPVIAGDRVYVTSDDGHLYCLQRTNGALIWRFRGGPSDGKLIGNEQMISHWPARSGVLVDGERLYFTAGMWSRDGVFIYCLHGEDGSVVWRNDTSGFHFTSLPHSSGFGGVAPQGYLALHRDRLYVPTGRGAPACFDARTGEFVFYENGLGYKPHQPGGSRVMAFQDWVIFKRRVQHVEEDVRYEERGPAGGSASGLFALDFLTGLPAWSLTDKNVVVGHGDTMILGGHGAVIKVDVSELMEGYQKFWRDGKSLGPDPSIPESGVDYAWAGKPKVDPKPAWMSPLPFAQWEADVGRVFLLVQAGNTILAGGREKVSAIDSGTGEILWQKKIEGDARGICVVDGHFVVSSTEGRLYGFGQGEADSETLISDAFEPPEIDAQTRQQARSLLETSGIRAGYALMLGTGDGQLLCELANQSELVIYCLEPDPEKARKVRVMLDRAGLLGVRAAVHQGDLDRLPYHPYLANLLIWGDRLGSPVRRVSGKELHRVLRPYGGVAVQLAGEDTEEATRRWLAAADVPQSEVTRSELGMVVKRGEPAGAGQWTHAYANIGRTSSSEDRLARLPLGMLWWGGPGPARIVSRHWRAPVPLFSHGVLYIQGQHDVMAVDAYNGREMWNRHLENVGRFPPGNRGGNIVADEASVFCVQGPKCLRLDAQTGETRMEYVVELEQSHVEAAEQLLKNYARPVAESHIVWEYLGVSGDFLIGTLGIEESEAARSTPYMDAPGSGSHLLVFNKATGKLIWQRRMERAVSPMAIVADQARLYCLDRTDERLFQQRARRGDVDFASSLLALDLAKGGTLWEKPGVRMEHKALMLKDDVIVSYPNPTEITAKDGDAGVAVYSTTDGRMLWEKRNLAGVSGSGRGAIIRHTLIVGDTLFLPWAYDLRTGQERLLRRNPLTDEPERFTVCGQNFCGTIAAGQDSFAYRSASVGFEEISRDSGSFWLPEVRPSCWISVIPAGGIVLAPEGYSTCICPYNYKTSLALVPVQRYEDWSVYLAGGREAVRKSLAARKAKAKLQPGEAEASAPEIKALRVNFGAPGDQMDGAGRLWLTLPRPTIREVGNRYLDIELPVEVEGVRRQFRYNADFHPVAGTQTPWLFTSGVEGPLKVTAWLSDRHPHKYTVRLLFAETEKLAAGERVFDVGIQGSTVLSRFDIVGEAGGVDRACVRQFENVPAEGTMTIELSPVHGKPPRLCSFEIIQQE